mmetsp:Transcript_78739/g.200417  ORF Transcript_78739/g.200417 Transcript_78739/m.200417 type:complete len:219 (+) Transcript_78739:224-880(+)
MPHSSELPRNCTPPRSNMSPCPLVPNVGETSSKLSCGFRTPRSSTDLCTGIRPAPPAEGMLLLPGQHLLSLSGCEDAAMATTRSTQSSSAAATLRARGRPPRPRSRPTTAAPAHAASSAPPTPWGGGAPSVASRRPQRSASRAASAPSLDSKLRRISRSSCSRPRKPPRIAARCRAASPLSLPSAPSKAQLPSTRRHGTGAGCCCGCPPHRWRSCATA